MISCFTLTPGFKEIKSQPLPFVPCRFSIWGCTSGSSLVEFKTWFCCPRDWFEGRVLDDNDCRNRFTNQFPGVFQHIFLFVGCALRAIRNDMKQIWFIHSSFTFALVISPEICIYLLFSTCYWDMATPQYQFFVSYISPYYRHPRYFLTDTDCGDLRIHKFHSRDDAGVGSFCRQEQKTIDEKVRSLC